MVSCTLTLKAYSVIHGTSLSFWAQTSHGYKWSERAVRPPAQKVKGLLQMLMRKSRVQDIYLRRLFLFGIESPKESPYSGF